jgi:hypothetical protein
VSSSPSDWASFISDGSISARVPTYSGNPISPSRSVTGGDGQRQLSECQGDNVEGDSLSRTLYDRGGEYMKPPLSQSQLLWEGLSSVS